MSDSGATASSTGSLTTSAPAAIVALVSPPKVSRRFEPGSAPGPAVRGPTVAAPITSGRVPQAFEMRTRSRLPPILTRGIIRSVWLLKAAPSAGAGAAVQVPTQWVLSAMGPPRELTGSRDYETTRRRLQGRRRRSVMSENCQDLDCLTGVRVVDFTQFEAGPSWPQALARLGAEGVKIENPKTGDPARRVVPGKAPDDPWYFHMFNANKKSLAIDLKSPRGVHLVKELLEKADVTVENMAPGTIERLGLGYDEVKKLNPRIIYCSIQGFGAGSKFEKGLAFDMIAQAAGGMISVDRKSVV